MKIKNKLGFTLVEILVSTMILGIGVFGTYKLIGSNIGTMSNFGNNIQANSLLYNTTECIKGIGFTNFKISTQTGYSFNFGSGLTKCNTGVLNNDFTFSGIIVDNIEYFITGEISNSGLDFIDFDLIIYGDGIKNIEKEFKLLKNK